MTSNLAKIAKTSTDKELGGVWVNYTPTIRFKIARMCERNKAYGKRMEELSRPLNKASAAKQADMTDVMPLSKKAFLETCVLDWDGVVNAETNEPIPCTSETVVQELGAEGMEDVVNFLWGESLDVSNYRESDEKN